MTVPFIATNDADRRPPPQINAFRQFVKQELNRRKLEYISPISSPFARMTSCLESTGQNYKYFSIGFHGFDEQDQNMFDLSYGQSKDVIGYAYKNGKKTPIDVSEVSTGLYDFGKHAVSEQQLDVVREQGQGQFLDLTGPALAEGKHPTPGIVDVGVERFAEGAGFRTTVVWLCYNRQQLEFLRHHFMTVGTTVVVEWGQEFFDSKSDLKLLDFSNDKITNELAQCIVNGRNYIIDNYVNPSRGNYDFNVGTVSNFSVNVDAKTNTYKVTTQIISAGEYMWGTSIQHTLDILTDNIDKKITSIADYFKYNGNFDDFINNQVGANLDSNGNIVDPSVNSSVHAPVANTVDGATVQSNANDYKFISWPGLFDMLRDLLVTLMDSNSAQDSISIKNIMEFIQLDGNDIRVGDNPWLISNNPETMLIIREVNSYFPDAPPPAFTTSNGYFGPTIGVAANSKNAHGFASKTATSNQSTGLASLNHGIWLNTGMVRTAFLNSVTLEQAIRSMLYAMNNASTGYWDLRLFYDEDTSTYKIVDYKFGQSFNDFKQDCQLSPLYMFNSGRCVDASGNTIGPSPSDLLNLNLDSAFPPEVITHLALVAKIKSAPDKWGTEMAKYPLFAGSAHFALAMNWTDLDDIVSREVDSVRGTLKTANQITPQTELVDSTPTDVQTRISSMPGIGGHRVSSPTVEDTTIQNSNTTIPTPSKTFVSSFNKANKYDDIIKKYVGEYLNESSWKVYIDPIVRKEYEPLFPDNTINWVNLVKALIQKESNFNEDAIGGIWVNGVGLTESELTKILTNNSPVTSPDSSQVACVGLMQVKNIDVLSSPRPLTLAETKRQKLYGPDSADTNIKAGIKILASKLQFGPDGESVDIEKTLAYYNAGSATRRYDALESFLIAEAIKQGNPQLARSSVWVNKYFPDKSKLLRNRDNVGGFVPLFTTGLSNPKYFEPRPNKYFNAVGYVDDILSTYRNYEYLTLTNETDGSVIVGNEETNTKPRMWDKNTLEDTTPEVSQPSDVEPEQDDITKKLLEYQTRFGDWIFPLIIYDPSYIRNKILRDGMSENNFTQGNNINGFIAPIPTTAKVKISLLGISGISMYDGFVVDKLPYIYEKFGIFHIVGISETITSTGWVTEIEGVFRFLTFTLDASSIQTYPKRL